MLGGYVSPLLAACALPLLAPVQGSGRDYCRSPLPCTGGSSGQSPGPPRVRVGRAQTRPTAVSDLCRPCRSRPPPRGLPSMFFSCSSLVLPLLAACALPLLAPVQGSGRDYCRSPLPCTGARRGNPPARPAAFGRSRPPPRGLPISSLFSIWFIFH